VFVEPDRQQFVDGLAIAEAIKGQSKQPLLAAPLWSPLFPARGPGRADRHEPNKSPLVGTFQPAPSLLCAISRPPVPVGTFPNS
jgi:hypothetical protein